MTETDTATTLRREFPFFGADTRMPQEARKYGVQIIYPYRKDIKWSAKSATIVFAPIKSPMRTSVPIAAAR